ncbi:hypothetical protein HELRODRAFT_86841 [Helobdella robusta]|uniref:5'-AMP-activated protein kinase subunit beta-1 n=1 Tax=Helobdella robusta TaxID=6412 RepID=T1G6I0_HELRO|nr:hypothetical protein HELRODRAFT_86841 [Helobdella robusta]ESN95351.1 hypothetical protein HELRODRAFT_86841 [Helobdella robusta]
MVSLGSPQSLNIRVGIDINARKLPTVFRWTGEGKNCFLSGSFDNWNSLIPLVKSVNDFFTIIELPEGTYQYKYLIDNQWMCDNNQDKVPNSFGTHNNVISVRPSDFEVFEALGTDSLATGHMKNSKIGEYGQYIPPKESSYHGVKHTFPPILPPHLLQVILNKEVPLHCEPSLLPEPNHVMLNHLYALSIKDGVMVLSTTHRYRKKYVTTLIYKPI